MGRRWREVRALWLGAGGEGEAEVREWGEVVVVGVEAVRREDGGRRRLAG